MIRPKISKEEVNLLPVILFDGKITIVDDPENVQQAIDELRKCRRIGIDTETKPSFTRGTFHKVSLLQLSTLDHCFLFRLNKIGFPMPLADLMADVKIAKIGLSLRDDIAALNKHLPLKPGNFIDIQTIAKNYGILELSLQKIYAILFDKKISKAQRLTNWENDDLSEQQIRYAATDAWASLQIYLQLLKEKKLSKKQIEKIVLDNMPEQAINNSLTISDHKTELINE